MSFKAVICTFAETGLTLKISPSFSFRFFAIAWVFAHGETIGIRKHENQTVISKILELTENL